MLKYSKLVKSMFTLCSLNTENDYLINKEAQPGRSQHVLTELAGLGDCIYYLCVDQEWYFNE